MAEGLKLSESVPFLCEISLYGTAVPGSPFAIAIRRVEPVDVTFTTLGTEGHNGPPTIGTHYDGPQLEGRVTLIEGYQRWEVPYTGRYRIEAHGAANHPQRNREGNNLYRHVGNGAVTRGEFQLRAGQSLLLLVGQRPVNPIERFSGGGGGTFVTVGTDHRTAEPIRIAREGGGAWRAYDSEKRDPTLCHATTVYPS